MDLRSGRLDGLPLLFRFRSWAIRIQSGLFAVFLDALLYHAVGNRKHAIHEVREGVVLD